MNDNDGGAAPIRGINSLEWMFNFDARERSEIAFNRLYMGGFNHGTDGHNMRKIISRMADLLDDYDAQIRDLEGKLNGRV